MNQKHHQTYKLALFWARHWLNINLFGNQKNQISIKVSFDGTVFHFRIGKNLINFIHCLYRSFAATHFNSKSPN